MSGLLRALSVGLVFALLVTASLAAPEEDAATEDAATEDAATTVVEVQIIPPQVIIKSQVAPDYPPAALAARFEGVVVLELKVLKDGTVGDAKVLKCSHPAIGFEAAAIAATKQWRFEAALKEGEPIDYEASFRVNFRVAPGGQPYVSWGSGTYVNDQVRSPSLAGSARTPSLGK